MTIVVLTQVSLMQVIVTRLSPALCARVWLYTRLYAVPLVIWESGFLTHLSCQISCMLLATLSECASTMLILAAVSQKLIPQCPACKNKFVVHSEKFVGMYQFLLKASTYASL